MGLEKIKSTMNKKAKDLGLETQAVWDIFFFESFIKRLSKSDYKGRFVFKGGFLLSNIVGISKRTTMDLDLKAIQNQADSAEIENSIKAICLTDIGDGVTFDFVSIEDIAVESKYGGKTVKVEGHFSNIRKTFNVDIGTGDIITPGPIDYGYKSLISDSSFDILAYPVETIMAEKFESFISKGVNNSRSKDIFDIYLLSKEKINDEKLVASVINTFFYRGTKIDKEYIDETIDKVTSFDRIRALFESYCKKHPFTAGVTFDDCVFEIRKIASLLAISKFSISKDVSITLDLIRHGQDEPEKMGGWSDSHLTDEGIRQVRQMASKMNDKYDCFISSDLFRAKETANIINERLGMEIVFDPSFRETNNGDLKNLTGEEFSSRYPNLLFTSLRMNQEYPNGESPLSFFKRVNKAFFDLIAKENGKRVLLVSHGGVITSILSIVYGFPYSNLLKICPSFATRTRIVISKGRLLSVDLF